MQAVILAGGLGTRLRPLTDTIPKAMVPVRGEPFISLLLKLFGKGDMDNVVLCLGYRAHQIINFVIKKDWGMQLFYSIERTPLGMAGAIKSAERLLDDAFLVINGDTYLPIDYSDVMAKFIEWGKKAMIVAYNNKPYSGVKNDLSITSGGNVIKCSKSGPEAELNYVNAGVVALRKEVVQLLPKQGDLESFYPELIKNNELNAYITRQIFYDIGTFEGIKRLEEYLDSNPDTL